MCNIGPYSSQLDLGELGYAQPWLKTFGLELSDTQQALCTGRPNLLGSAKCLGDISLLGTLGVLGPYKVFQVNLFSEK